MELEELQEQCTGYESLSRLSLFSKIIIMKCGGKEEGSSLLDMSKQ